MPQVAIFVLLITLLTVYKVKSDSHVIVRPTDSNSSICGGHAVCDSLYNFISNTRNIFSYGTNTKFEFLQGVHKVYKIKHLVIKGSQQLSWHGSDKGRTEIVCMSPSGFLFLNISTLSIKNLRFSKCGYRPDDIYIYPYQFHLLTATLSLIEVTSVRMENIVILRSRGYGLLGLNLRRNNSIVSSVFVKNIGVFDNSCEGGNAAFYFEDREKTKDKVSLKIAQSIFQGGANLCDDNVSVDLYSKFFPEPFKANGLFLTTKQTYYKVEVIIVNTRFIKNTHSSLHLTRAILMHNKGRQSNNFKIIHCTFEEEGTLVITNYNYDLEQQKVLEAAVPYVQLRNCNFTNSSYKAVDLLLHLTSTTRHNQISIHRCTFKYYKNTQMPTTSIVYILYFIDGFWASDYSGMNVTIKRSLFMFNKMATIFCESYLHNVFFINKNQMPMIVLNQTTFKNNYFQKVSIVRIREHRSPETQKPTPNELSQAHIFLCTFKNNTFTHSLQIEDLNLILYNSTFISSNGTALYATSGSFIQVEGFNQFIGNNGKFGGALFLNRSRLLLASDSFTLIANNSALYGGGIFAISEGSDSYEYYIDDHKYCTIGLLKTETGNTTAKIKFDGNRAKYNGRSIFGGTYTKCLFSCTDVNNCNIISENPFETIIHISRNKHKSTEIVIPPTKLRICENVTKEINDCHAISTTLSAFPGQTITVPLVAISEVFNEMVEVTVIGTVCQRISETGVCKRDDKNDIGYGQKIQGVIINQKSTNVRYTVNSQINSVIEVKMDDDETENAWYQGEMIAYHPENEGKIIIRVNITQCPPGLEFHDSKENGEPSACKCLSYFTKHSVYCNINNGSVTKPRNKWIFSSISRVINTVPMLINRTVVHNSCPYDYCIREEISVNLSEPHEQCNFNRTGVLCGACGTNLSIVLGTSNCKKCSNMYLLLIIPFALAGVALVVLLLKCNLTVSVGHINGIIFYANIVQVNKALFFQNQSIAGQIFTTFIAWLNLDLGIETCFFESMDSYAKMWLQFVFPVYLWIIAGIIIILAYYSSRIEVLIGSNSVPVLATLFLLSYAKLLRAIIAAMYFTYIKFEDESHITVWFVDGNVEYFSPKHALLFSVALLFALLYTLPLTLLVLLAPCLQARSHHKAFNWVNKLKPFLDAYTGPYSNKFRYWTGMLLLARLGLFIVYTINFYNDLAISFSCTTAITVLLTAVLIKQDIYRHKLANWIELISLLNITILYSVNWLTTTTGYKEWYPVGEYVTYISVTVIMLVFLCVIIHQLRLKVCPNAFTFEKRDTPVESLAHSMNAVAPTSSVVELSDCDQWREPLLEESN